MKKFLAVAAILAVTSANAEELKFGDLNYFLKQGQQNVGVDFLVNNEVARLGGGDEIETDAYFLNTKYTYALTDSFNAFIGLNFLLDGENETSQAGGASTTDASADSMGLQNPTLGANFRLLNQNNAGFNLDFGAVASVKLTDREVGTADKEGNMLAPLYSNYADPRSGVEVTARLGKKWNEANEFYLVSGVNYHMDGEYDQLEGDTVDMDSSIDFKLGGFYQYRPVYEFMMTFGLTATRYGEMDGNDGSEDFTTTDHIDYQFSFDAKYLVTETMIAKFMFRNDRRSEFDYEQSSGDSEVDKRSGAQYGLGVDFLF